MFFTAFFPPLSISRPTGSEGGWVNSEQSPTQVFCLLARLVRQKLRRRRLFESLLSDEGTELFQLTKCFMAVKYDDTARELVH